MVHGLLDLVFDSTHSPGRLDARSSRNNDGNFSCPRSRCWTTPTRSHAMIQTITASQQLNPDHGDDGSSPSTRPAARRAVGLQAGDTARRRPSTQGRPSDRRRRPRRRRREATRSVTPSSATTPATMVFAASQERDGAGVDMARPARPEHGRPGRRGPPRWPRRIRRQAHPVAAHRRRPPTASPRWPSWLGDIISFGVGRSGPGAAEERLPGLVQQSLHRMTPATSATPLAPTTSTRTRPATSAGTASSILSATAGIVPTSSTAKRSVIMAYRSRPRPVSPRGTASLLTRRTIWSPRPLRWRPPEVRFRQRSQGPRRS